MSSSRSQLAHPGSQVLQLLLHLAVVEDVAVDPLHPVGGGGDAAAHRGGDGVHQVGQGVGLAAHHKGEHPNEDGQQKGDYQQQYSVLPEKILHFACSFSAARARESTPNRASIRASRHTGSPITL